MTDIPGATLMSKKKAIKDIHKIQSAQEVAVNTRSRSVRDDIDPYDVLQVLGSPICVQQQQAIMDRIRPPSIGPSSAPLVNTGFNGDNDISNNTATVEEVRDAPSLLNKPNSSQLSLDPTVEGAFIAESEGQPLMNTQLILTPPPTQEDYVVSTAVPTTPTLLKPPVQLKQVGDRDTCVDDKPIAEKVDDLESLLGGPNNLSPPYTRENRKEDDVDAEEQKGLLPPDDNVTT